MSQLLSDTCFNTLLYASVAVRGWCWALAACHKSSCQMCTLMIYLWAWTPTLDFVVLCTAISLTSWSLGRQSLTLSWAVWTEWRLGVVLNVWLDNKAALLQKDFSLRIINSGKYSHLKAGYFFIFKFEPNTICVQMQLTVWFLTITNKTPILPFLLLANYIIIVLEFDWWAVLL